MTGLEDLEDDCCIVLEVGQDLPEEVLEDDARRELPVIQRHADGTVNFVAHAWMLRLDLRYYRRIFPGSREYTRSIMAAWQVPRNRVEEVMALYSDIEEVLYDPALERKEAEELTTLYEEVWKPRMDQIYQLVEEFRQ